MNTKTWTNHWVCDPAFWALKPLPVYHKEHDKTFSRPHHQESLENVHTLFRQKFVITSADMEENAVFLDISADDYYKLYINGEFICQGPAPAYTSSYNYNQINISKFLNQGKNIIAVHVYYQGLINRVWNSGDNRMGLVADILHSGEFEFGTDESWLYDKAEEYSGDTTEYSTQFREDIDFCKKKADWNNINSARDCYKKSKLVKCQDWRFKDKPVPNVEVYTVKPSKIIKKGEAVYLMDFGNEITGQIYFKAKGEEGQKVCVKYGEELDDDGSVRYKMRCNCNYYDVCTLSGGEDEFEFFDY